MIQSSSKKQITHKLYISVNEKTSQHPRKLKLTSHFQKIRNPNAPTFTKLIVIKINSSKIHQEETIVT